jgi:hypothetical protein
MRETEMQRGKLINEKTVMHEKRHPVYLSTEQQEDIINLLIEENHVSPITLLEKEKNGEGWEDCSG